MASPPAELTTLLSRLAASGVDFVLVGGLAAVAQGAPLTTQDVDIVHRRTPDNVENLLGFGDDERALPRPFGHRPCAFGRRAAWRQTQLAMTDLGPLDVLGTIEGGRGYDELLPGAISIAVAGHPVKVLGLSMLAELKRGSASNKDKLTLLILEETLRRQT